MTVVEGLIFTSFIKLNKSVSDIQYSALSDIFTIYSNPTFNRNKRNKDWLRISREMVRENEGETIRASWKQETRLYLDPAGGHRIGWQKKNLNGPFQRKYIRC